MTKTAVAASIRDEQRADPPAFSITVSGLAGSHPLDLARQLTATGHLAAYYTTLPASRTSGVDPRRVRRCLPLLVPIHGLMHGWLPMERHRLSRRIDVEFDRWASRRLIAADVVHAVAGLGLRQRHVARRRGALTVCDSGTTHIGYHTRIQAEECRRWSAPPVPWTQGDIAWLEQEYDEADLVLVPSRFAYDTFVASGVPAAKLALVPYGVDIEEYRPVPRRDALFRILFVGTLGIRKGLPYLLDAVSTLRLPGAELALRGAHTPESQALLARYRGSIPITMIPPQPREAMKELYSSASVLVLPSVEDGFGLVIGQALACGTPVIASTHTGGPDIIEEGVTGYLVPARDSRALRDAILRAHEHRDVLREMGRRGRERLEATGGWCAYGAGIVAAFHRALKSRR